MSDLKTIQTPFPHEMVSLRVGGQDVCIDVMSVREIRVWTPATPLAHSPRMLIGVIDLRGGIVPIVDFADRLGFAPTVPTSRHAILVVEIGQQVIGLLVEEVTEIITIDPDRVQPTPEIYAKSSGMVRGMISVNNRLISIIDLADLVPVQGYLEAA
jgi:purine-binding chemotaxis protein CheW